MNTTLIALAGLKRSGKSTSVDIIKEIVDKKYTVHQISFASPLKRLVTDIFCLQNDECYDSELKEKVIPQWNVTPRELLQKIGTELFRNQLETICPNIKLPAETIWASSLYYKVKEITEPNSIVLIDDCRFNDEYNTVKKLGGVVIKISRSSDTSDAVNSTTHDSEKGCNYDYEIINDKTIKDLKNELINVCKSINIKMN